MLSVVVLGREPSSSAVPHQVGQACSDNNSGAILSQLQVPQSSKNEFGTFAELENLHSAALINEMHLQLKCFD